MDIQNLRVEKVHYSRGQITQFMLSDGRVIGLEQMLDMIRHGEIIGYSIGHSKDNKAFVRVMPNSEISDNLNNLETF